MALTLEKQHQHDGLRRTGALAILALFLAHLCCSVAFPQWASESSLPVCCRAHGKHKCFLHMRGMAGTTSTQPAIAQLSERCPYSPAFPVSLHETSAPPPRALRLRNSAQAGSPYLGTDSFFSSWLLRESSQRGPPHSSTFA